MGRQINYYMEFESFLKLCEKALTLGFELVKEDSEKGTIITSHSTEIITEDKNRYYFHLPEAGELASKKVHGADILDRGYTACSNSIIEASFSQISEAKGIITSERLYLQTGYYNEDSDFIRHPECIDNAFSSLMRYVKKLAPYTELTERKVSLKDEDYGKEYEYKIKKYITPYCLDLVLNNDYKAR